MNKLLFLLLSFSACLSAQERKAMQGRIVYGSLGIKDVLVVNNNAQAETRTDSLGNFTLNMQVGDLLIITDRKIETRKIRYTPDLVKNGIVVISVVQTVQEIEEVVINRSTVTSKSLGIPMGKAYTPAERRLRTASNFDPTIGLGTMPGVAVSFDAILNAINGRTARLKKELEIERKEFALAKLDALFTESYYTETLAIPTEDVPAFKHYAVEDSALMASLNDGTKENIEFLLSGIAAKYKQLNTDEK